MHMPISTGFHKFHPFLINPENSVFSRAWKVVLFTDSDIIDSTNR
jgi:hypothetical protein